MSLQAHKNINVLCAIYETLLAALIQEQHKKAVKVFYTNGNLHDFRSPAKVYTNTHTPLQLNGSGENKKKTTSNGNRYKTEVQDA